jgi:hypothetical protein
LNPHQSNKQIYYSFVITYFYPSPLYLASHSSRLESLNPEPLGSVMSIEGSPHLPHALMGSLPSEQGSRGLEAYARFSCIPHFWWVSLDACYHILRSALRVHGDVFLCQHATPLSSRAQASQIAPCTMQVASAVCDQALTSSVHVPAGF